MDREEAIRQEIIRMAEHFRPHDLPHMMVPDLSRNDIVCFQMAMAEVRVRILDPFRLTMAPLRWGIFKGFVRYNGALDEISRIYTPMALIPGQGARFAHPGDNGTYIDIGPATKITINGQCIK